MSVPRPLPPALAGLAECRQFVGWKSVTVDGVLKKFPTNHLGDVIDAQDSRYWMDYDTAASWAEASGINVGFVFTESDPFFFADVDKCADPSRPSGWSETAETVLSYFPGAAVEVSQSGEGLHIIGRATAPPHSMRNAQYGLEFYTSKRFIALTMRDCIGDCTTDHTPMVAQYIANFFPPRPEHDAGAEWTDGPNKNSRPLKTDDALIRKMLASVSVAGGFGIRATVRQLWEADAAALGALWPADKETDAFNHSNADAALCLHLAFWTGGDCERIDRLFRKSALYREKWERDDYRTQTILRAVGLCTQFYGAEKAARENNVIHVGGPRESSTTATLLSGPRVVPFEDRLKTFAGHVYLEKQNAVFCPDGEVRDMTRYNGMYAGYEYAEPFGGKPIKKAWDAYVGSPNVQRAEAFDIAFRPKLPIGAIVEIGHRRHVNSYMDARGARKNGNPHRFLDHVRKLLPIESDAEVLLQYLAACVQFIGVKFQWCPVIQGVEGNGKSFFYHVVAYAVGERYAVLPNAADISNRFNGWLENALLVGIEEVHTVGRQDLTDILKIYISNPRLEIQRKGENQRTADNCANFLLFSNHMGAVEKTENDRRYAPLFTAQQTFDDIQRDGMTGNYFRKLYGWLHDEDGLAIVAEYLATRPVTIDLQGRAPSTSSTQAAISASLSEPAQRILAAIDSGELGFRGDLLCVKWVDDYLRGLRLPGCALGPQKLAAALKSIGYIKHPALIGGEGDGRVSIEGTRHRIYVKRDSLAASLPTPETVAEAWRRALSEPGPLPDSARLLPYRSGRLEPR